MKKNNEITNISSAQGISHVKSSLVSKIVNLNLTIKIKSFFITDSKGKIVLARQFSEISKRELFGLNSSFLRNVEGNLNINYFDGETERFVFQIVNGKKDEQRTYFLVLVVDLNFNIIEALEIIKTIHRFINEILNIKDNSNLNFTFGEKVKEFAYEIILSVDDIVNPLMGSERLSISQVQTCLKMDSAEEKVHIVAQKAKEEKARDDMIKQMEEIEKLKRENKYISNSVSSDMISSKPTIPEPMAIESSAESINRSRNSGMSSGLNLKQRLLRKMMHEKEEELRIKTFLFAYENIIQTMLVNEMKRMKDLEGEFEEPGNTIFFGPVEVMFEETGGSDDDS